MVCATVSSWSCFCWLYRTSASSAAENIISLISVLTIWWCPCVVSSLVLLEEGVCYDQWVLLTKLCCPASFCTPRSWLWQRLKERGEGDDRGWDGWVASLTQGTWIWVHSRRQWRTESLVCCILFQIGKGVHQGRILSPCLFNLCAEYITRNAGLEEAQAGIKIAGRNINNLLAFRTLKINGFHLSHSA